MIEGRSASRSLVEQLQTDDEFGVAFDVTRFMHAVIDAGVCGSTS